MNERDLFIAVRQIQNAAEREEFLRQQCEGDDELRKRVEILLAEQVELGSFLESPAAQLAQTYDEPPEQRIGSMIGPYKLLEQIGEGGFGVVYMAEQAEPLRRKVALKVIKPGMDSRQVIARFEAERQALAIMDHPNIAKVLDAGATPEPRAEPSTEPSRTRPSGTAYPQGRPFFVLELVKGVSITKFCDQHRLTTRQRLELFVPVCHAIQHAHRKGIIHRDIKPSNILVAMYDDQPVPKVIDFGVAKATGQQLTEQTLHTGFGAVVGSAEYMSPEQASFNQLDVDTRSDIYSLGVLLYELLVGSPPFGRQELEKAGLLEILRVVREQDPPKPSTKLSTAESLPTLAANRATEPQRLTSLVRGELDWIVMKTLEKDRNRRYETANDLAGDVARYLTGEAVVAHPPSFSYRARKLVVRHRVRLAVAMMFGFVLLSGLIWFATTQREVEKRRVTHSNLVSQAIEEASMALGKASLSPIGRDTEWVAASASKRRVEDLMATGPVQGEVVTRANSFLANYQGAESDRRLAAQIEEVVMMSATHEDRESWERMERQFRDLFKSRGLDLDVVPPPEVARRIREDPFGERLSDALELWIGTRGQLASLGGPRLTRESMQPWADAMYAADSDPVRTGIRKLIYGGTLPTLSDVEQVIEGVNLEFVSPRTLAWLGHTFYSAKAIDRCDDVFYFALDHHPGDFMLNFDFAYVLSVQERWEEAIRYYMRCVAIRPSVAGVWRSMGNSLRETGELTRAVESLKRAIKLEPDHAATYLDLARAELARESFPAAAEAARHALNSGSLDPLAYGCLGQALMHSGELAEALVALEKCHALASQNPRIEIKSKEWLDECRQKLTESK